MRTSYMLPSGTFNIFLSKTELQHLIDTGGLVTFSGRVTCTTGRSVWNSEKNDMETLDKKEIPNDLRFHLNEPVADIESGSHRVQFLNIHVL